MTASCTMRAETRPPDTTRYPRRTPRRTVDVADMGGVEVGGGRAVEGSHAHASSGGGGRRERLAFCGAQAGRALPDADQPAVGVAGRGAGQAIAGRRAAE